MQLTTKQTINTDFSMSSMTDIVFLLLIFFMLTVSSATPQALPVDLPTSDNAENDAVPQLVNVTITDSLKYYVDNQEVLRENLAATLKKALGASHQGVMIYVDKSVAVANMIYVADIAAALDAQVSIAVQPPAHALP